MEKIIQLFLTKKDKNRIILYIYSTNMNRHFKKFR